MAREVRDTFVMLLGQKRMNNIGPLQVTSDSVYLWTHWSIFSKSNYIQKVQKRTQTSRNERTQGEVTHEDTLPNIGVKRKSNNVSNRGGGDKHVLWRDC